MNFIIPLFLKEFKNFDIENFDNFNWEGPRKIIRILFEKYHLFMGFRNISFVLYIVIQNIFQNDLRFHFTHNNAHKVISNLINLFSDYPKEHRHASLSLLRTYLHFFKQFINEATNIETIDNCFKLINEVMILSPTSAADDILAKEITFLLMEIKKQKILNINIKNYHLFKHNNILKYAMGIIPHLENYSDSDRKFILANYGEYTFLLLCEHWACLDTVSSKALENFVALFKNAGHKFSFNCLQSIRQLNINSDKKDCILEHISRQKQNPNDTKNIKLNDEDLQLKNTEEVDATSHEEDLIDRLNKYCKQKNFSKIRSMEEELVNKNAKISDFFMYFYTIHEANYNKAAFYFHELTEILKIQKIDFKKLISFLNLSVKCQMSFITVKRILNSYSHKASHNIGDGQVLKEFVELVYFNFDSSQFKVLADIIEKNNYIDMECKALIYEFKFASLIQENLLDEAVELFEKCPINKLTVSEVDLIFAILFEDNFNFSKSKNFKKVFEIIYSDKSYAYNCLFIALVQANYFKMAENVLVKNLKHEINLKILENLVKNYLHFKKIYEKNIEITFNQFNRYCEFTRYLDSEQQEKIAKLLETLNFEKK